MLEEAHEESLGVPVRVGVKGLIITVHDGVKVLLTLGDSLLDAVKEAESMGVLVYMSDTLADEVLVAELEEVDVAVAVLVGIAPPIGHAQLFGLLEFGSS